MKKRRFLLSFLFSFNGMMYELMLSQNLSAALGGTLLRYFITIGLFTLCLGSSALAFDYFPEKYKSVSYLYRINLFFVVGLLFLPIYFYAAELMLGKNILSYTVFQYVYHAPLIVIALVTGFEIPYLFHGQPDDRKSQILAFDYIGMFLACLAFPLVFIESLGLFGSFAFILALQGLTVWLLKVLV
jgi:predicted membrane-bound spermidine synthase